MNSYCFEYATKENMHELYNLQLAAFESEATMIGSRNVPALLESYEHFSSDFYNWTVLVKKNDLGDIVGAVRYRTANNLVEVGRLFVMPEYRHQGIAIDLMKAVEEETKGHLFELYTCTKSWINIRLYEKLGYRIYKEEKGDKNLSFAYMRKSV